MTSTSDERREVAGKLRQMADRHDVDKCDVIHVFDDDDIRKLADLIDPTCHIAYDDWASRQCMGPMLSCDRCGNAFPKINGPYQYCPCCGARVVADDD